MNVIDYFSPQPTPSEMPTRLRDPFQNNPHALAILASDKLKQRLGSPDLLLNHLARQRQGKMFGVLVVLDGQGKTGYLAGFSGMLNQQWIVPGFVPPVFDVEAQQAFLRSGETSLNLLSEKIDNLLNCPARLAASQHLADLEQCAETQLAAFKRRNRHNKMARQLQRARCQTDRHEGGLMLELSRQSQRDNSGLRQLKSEWQAKLQQTTQIFRQSYEIEIDELKSYRRRLSQRLHSRVFDTYRLSNRRGEVASLASLFDGRQPPAGTGDCAAPKLLQYAYRHELVPLALAEFWWGLAPASGVRHDGFFYAPCRGKCHPLLAHMLKGQELEADDSGLATGRPEPAIVFEDEQLVVLNKPHGLLSIPGKDQEHSVLSWLRQKFPHATGGLLVHRLDMATSGLLLAAKNADAYRRLQKQFIRRSIKKRYVAVLSKSINLPSGSISLPLRVDLDDRPRQLVCYQHGKAAITSFKVITRDRQSTRVFFYPLTGRTHQLRVHAAHCHGLGAPIVGDALYGSCSERMLLHADTLSFDHPLSGDRITIRSRAPF